MAPSRKQSNGRSPLVNPQRQITTFFTKLSSPPTSSPQASYKTRTPTNSNPNRNSSSPDPSPNTPSPLQSKTRKSLLVIGKGSPSPSPSPQTPAAAGGRGLYGKEVVERRIRVYWPLDKTWYEGCVKSYDEGSGKHLVQYDDSEEELLDLGDEKIEWVEESVKRFKRLRKGCLGLKNLVVENNLELEDADDGGGDDNNDDSSDEDWGKNAKEVSEEEDGDLDLEDEDVEEDCAKGKGGQKRGSRKRNAAEAGGKLLGSAKKSKSGADSSNGKPKVNVVESTMKRESK